MKRLVALVFVVLGLVWGSGLGLAARLEVTVNKVSQKMTVKLDGETRYVWPVSTGRAGYDTPSGKFRPFRMEEDHFSTEWDDAPMPHSIFFTGDGHAIHGSEYVKSLGKRASHGCVRLSPNNAATLFEMVADNGMKNTSVVVKGGFFDFDGLQEIAVLPKGFKLGSVKRGTPVKARKLTKGRSSIFGALGG
jgi:L,D-transpeptidase catalytic domain